MWMRPGSPLHIQKGSLFSLQLFKAAISKHLAARKGFFTEKVVSHWKRLPGKWSQHQVCQSSWSIWMMLIVIWFSFR